MSSERSRADDTEADESSPFDALEHRLAALKQKMARGLPDRAKELEDAAARLEAASEDLARDARDEVRRFAHKLRGIAGSYGFPHLGELAAGVETAARSEDRPASEVVTLARDLAAAAREAGAPQSGVVDKSSARAVEAAATAPEAPPTEAPAPAPPRRAAMPTVAPELEGLVVLAADDDDATRRLLEITLVSLGRMQGTLFDRAPALLDELSRRERIDLVVVDAMMPDMNGLELLHAAAERGLADRVGQFVVLSAATPEELGWTLPAGLRVGWLRKPFRPKELLTQLVELRARAV